jgi:hypothetical protein
MSRVVGNGESKLSIKQCNAGPYSVEKVSATESVWFTRRPNISTISWPGTDGSFSTNTLSLNEGQAPYQRWA